MELKDIFCIKGNFGSAGSDKGNAKGNSNPRVFSIFSFLKCFSGPLFLSGGLCFSKMILNCIAT